MQVGRAGRARPRGDDAEGSGRRSGGGGGRMSPPSGGGLTRVTVNLNRQAVQALEVISGATGYSKTDTINRALQIYAIVQELMERSGGTLQVKLGDGEVERIHIV